MSKKWPVWTAEEREKLVQEIIKMDRDRDPEFKILGTSKKQRESLKTPIEKVEIYQCIVEVSVFWASRQDYLELVQSFFSKKIDGETLTDKFFQLRIQDIIKAQEFMSAVDEVYLALDQYSPTIDDWNWNDIVYSESKLRSVIQENYLPIMEKSCDLDPVRIHKLKKIRGVSDLNSFQEILADFYFE